MCNNYRTHVDLEAIEQDFHDLKIPLRFPEGRPNLEPRDSVRITERAPVIRRFDDNEAGLVQRRWSWPGRNDKPVYNFRSEGRQFDAGRCLIVADGFYEYTKPVDSRRKLKDKWFFTAADRHWFCIAGIMRDSAVGEAFTMLTTEPGPDVAPYHDRQVVVLDRSQWATWLDPETRTDDILRPSPAGTLVVRQLR